MPHVGAALAALGAHPANKLRAPPSAGHRRELRPQPPRARARASPPSPPDAPPPPPRTPLVPAKSTAGTSPTYSRHLDVGDDVAFGVVSDGDPAPATTPDREVHAQALVRVRCSAPDRLPPRGEIVAESLGGEPIQRPSTGRRGRAAARCPSTPRGAPEPRGAVQSGDTAAAQRYRRGDSAAHGAGGCFRASASERLRPRSREIEGRDAEHGEGSTGGAGEGRGDADPGFGRVVRREGGAGVREADVVAREVYADGGHRDGRRDGGASEERDKPHTHDLAHDVEGGGVDVALGRAQAPGHARVARRRAPRGAPGGERDPQRAQEVARGSPPAPDPATCRNGVAADTCGLNACAWIRVLTTSRGFTTTALTHAAIPAAPTRRRRGTPSSGSIPREGRGGAARPRAR